MMLRRSQNRFFRKALFRKVFNNCAVSSSQYQRCAMSYQLNQRSYEEINIPVPWGHIAGKWWGSKDIRPVLGIHGWQDNCGTFDPLVQYLPSHISLLAIDLPGHGLSSQLPAGLYHNGFDLIILLKRIINYFKWPKLSLVGHSLGGVTSYIFTSTFPNLVEFVIAFDTITPMSEIGKHVNCRPEIIDKFLIYDVFNSAPEEPPSYPLEKLDEILHEGSGKSVALESCKYLLARNTHQSKNDPNKYYFTRDTRLKLQYFMAWYYEKLMKDGHKITCPVMEIRGLYPFKSKSDTSVHYDVMNVMKKSSIDFQMHEIRGTHHLHLNNPEDVAPLVNKFINKYHSENKLLDDCKL